MITSYIKTVKEISVLKKLNFHSIEARLLIWKYQGGKPVSQSCAVVKTAKFCLATGQSNVPLATTKASKRWFCTHTSEHR